VFQGLERVTGEPGLEAVRRLAERVVASHGLALFDVQWRREAGGWVLRVVLDRPVRRDVLGRVQVEPLDGGIGLEECQTVSHDLGTLLDVENPFEVGYTFEVSSPGLDRALREPVDYERFAGRIAKIVVREPLQGQSHFEGRLAGLDEEQVVLEVGRTKIVRIPLAMIARARLDVEF
jgi:ribosome maturation factor RimP